MLNKIITLKDTANPIKEGSLYVHEGKVFISLDSFNKWFNLNANYSSEIYRIVINPRTKIPAEQRYLREKAKKKLLAKKKNSSNNFDFSKYETVKSKEYWINFPILDLSYGGSTSGSFFEGLTGFAKTLTNFRGNYSVAGDGSIFYLRSAFSLSFTKGKVSGLNLSMKRKFYNGLNLFPFYKGKKLFNNSLKITHFATANVTVENLPLSSGGGSGVGFVIDNYPVESYSNEYYPIISGYTEPNWDIEFINDNRVIGYTQADSNGYYEFKGFSLQSGKNDLTIKSYGPYGEVKTEVRKYVHSTSLLKQGELLYKFSIANKKSLTDLIFAKKSISDDYYDSDIGNKSNNGKFNAALSLHYGLTDKLSIKSNYGRYIVGTDIANYLSTEIASLYFNSDVKLTVVRDIKNKAFAYRLYYSKVILGKPIYFSYELYDQDYVGGAKSSTSGSPLRSKFFTALSGNKVLPLIDNISYSFTYNRISYRDNFKEHKIDFNFGETNWNFII